MNIPISPSDSTLNITKLINTNTIVYKCDKNPFFRCFNKNTFSITRKTKKYIPHKIKFQFAPCQKPVFYNF